ncbi:Lactosylceramide 1,3-N-acetyl-beta-D-glucosaminyltransferase B [Bulinus truncatus]|nr:Lactosylceramide 1,3-N-acetyl-beta-D-glucosaminyltransferase B [Bulinus truncatus]
MTAAKLTGLNIRSWMASGWVALFLITPLVTHNRQYSQLGHRTREASLWIIISLFSPMTSSKLRFSIYEVGNHLMVQTSQTEQSIEIQSSSLAKADLTRAVFTCIADALTFNNQSVVTDYESRLAEMKSELTKLEHAYKGLQAETLSKDDVIDFLSQPIVNDHEFEYIHNQRNVCSEGDAVRVLYVVPSAPENFAKRREFRKNGLYEFVKTPSNKMKLLFFLGRHPVGREKDDIQEKIDNESEEHNDLIQEDFEDVYANIRLKAVSMLRWAHTFCRKATYVIRSDDDVKFKFPQLLTVVEVAHRRYKNFVVGDRKDGWGPHRNSSSKYYLSEEEFPEPTLPPFAVGGLLAYPISTVSLLYQAALRVRPVWLDDVYITGICALRVGVPLLTDPVFVFDHSHS